FDRLTQSNAGARSTGVEDGGHRRRADTPRASGRRQQVGEIAALETQQTGERDTRKVLGSGDADLRVCRDERLLRLTNVGPALEEQRRQSYRHRGARVEGVDEAAAPRQIPWRLSEQQVQSVFGLGALSLHARDLCS